MLLYIKITYSYRPLINWSSTIFEFFLSLLLTLFKDVFHHHHRGGFVFFCFLLWLLSVSFLRSELLTATLQVPKIGQILVPQSYSSFYGWNKILATFQGYTLYLETLRISTSYARQGIKIENETFEHILLWVLELGVEVLFPSFLL